MKKILSILITTILIISCSSSDESNQISSNILPKKEVWSDGTICDYLYQGDKLVKVQCNDGSSTLFTYSGNLITKVEFINPNSINNRDEFSYSNGVLTQIKEFNGNTLFKKHDITNIDANTKSRITTTYNNSSTAVTKYREYFSNSVLIKQEKLNPNNTINWTNTFTYDLQNFVYKNITGYSLIANWYDWGGPFNNIKKVVFNQTNFSQSTNYLYLYNSDGYPIKCTISTSGSGNDVVEYTY